MKMLAITSAKRSPLMPDLPTMREGGVTDYELIGWFGLLAPANTPPSVIETLSRAVKNVAIDPRFIAAMVPQGMTIIANAPAEMAEVMKWTLKNGAMWSPRPVSNSTSERAQIRGERALCVVIAPGTPTTSWVDGVCRSECKPMEERLSYRLKIWRLYRATQADEVRRLLQIGYVISVMVAPCARPSLPPDKMVDAAGDGRVRDLARRHQPEHRPGGLGASRRNRH